MTGPGKDHAKEALLSLAAAAHSQEFGTDEDMARYRVEAQVHATLAVAQRLGELVDLFIPAPTPEVVADALTRLDAAIADSPIVGAVGACLRAYRRTGVNLQANALLEELRVAVDHEAHRTITAGILASLEPDPQARETLRRDALLAMARAHHVLGRRLVGRLLAVVVPHLDEPVRWEGWGRIVGAGPADAVGHAAGLAKGDAR